MKYLIFVFFLCIQLNLHSMEKSMIVTPREQKNKKNLGPTKSIEEMSTLLLHVALEAGDNSFMLSTIENGADFKSILSSGNITIIKILLEKSIINPIKPLPNSTETPLHYFQQRYNGKNKEEILALLKKY